MNALPATRREAIQTGSPRYFTGAPCGKGHLSERYTDRATCVECNNGASAKYRASHPGVGSENVRRWKERHPAAAKELYASAGRKWRYGLTKESYLGLLEEQEFKCAVCGTGFDCGRKSTRPHVDHCHATGKVRGILCHHCNSALGHLRDSPETARSAASYLEASSRCTS